MDATVRTYGTAGLALVAAGVIAVTPVAPPPDLHIATANVRLTSGDAAAATAGDALSALGTDLGYFDWGSLLNLHTLGNIATNLFYDILKIPYNWLQAVDFYSKAALGYPGVYGTNQDPHTLQYDPQNPNPELAGAPGDPAKYPIYGPVGVTGADNPDGSPATDVYGDPVHSYVPIGLGGTGSWWMESTGNTWGWDEGNFGQVLGLANMIVPIPQFSTPFAYELQAFAMQQVVANPDACPFECSNILGYLQRWFNVPFNDQLTGVKVGLNFGGDDGTAADPTGTHLDPMGIQLSWAGKTVQFDPFFFITSFLKSLAADPAGDPAAGISANMDPLTAYGELFSHPLQNIVGPFLRIIGDLWNDFIPILNGSFIYWGLPSGYTVPTITAGLLSYVTGIANPMETYSLAPGGAFALGPYVGQPATDGTGPDGALDPVKVDPITGLPAGSLIDFDHTHLVNPLDLPLGFLAGTANWFGGLIAYLDPYTYLNSLGVTGGAINDMDAATLATTLATALKMPDPTDPGGFLEGLSTGLYNWHETLHDLAIKPLAEFSNWILPWYTDLSIGMEQLLSW
ncbi:MAG TPA: hypothetical protein VFQ37_17825 [Mycobacterium sp.]|nr:hypothetical protein [Mycobacterium sp.]